MKLSEVKGERVFDVIADLVDPIVAIASSEDVQGAFKKADGDNVKKMTAVLPVVLKNHRADIVKVICAVNGEDPEEYMEGITLMRLLKDANELASDKELLDFFS